MKIFSTLLHDLTSASYSLLCGLTTEAGHYVGKTGNSHRPIMTHHQFNRNLRTTKGYILHSQKVFQQTVLKFICRSQSSVIFVCPYFREIPFHTLLCFYALSNFYNSKHEARVDFTIPFHAVKNLSVKPWSRDQLVHFFPHSTKSLH